MGNSFYFSIYVFISLFLIIFSIKIFKLWFNPLSVYSFIFLINVIFNFFLPLYHPETYTWLVLISCLLIFTLGSFFGSHFGLKRNFSKSKYEDERKYQILGLISVLLAGIYILVFIYLNKDTIFRLLAYGFNSFFYRTYSFYISSQYKASGYLEGLLPLSSIYVGILDGLEGKLHKRTILFLVSLTIFAFFTGLRTILFMSLGLYSVCILIFLIKNKRHLDKKKINKIKIGLVSVIGLGLALLFLITYNRSLFDKKDIGLGETSFKDSVFIEMGGHIGRLAYFLEEREHLNTGVGAFTLGPVMRSICEFYKSPDFCDEKFPRAQPSAPIPFIWIGGTYLMDLYADFGIFGIIFGPFLLGWLSSFAWFRAQKGDLFQLGLSSFLMVFIINSFRFSLTFAGNFFLACILFVLFVFIYKIFASLSGRSI